MTGACVTICPSAYTACATAGAAVTGFVTGIRDSIREGKCLTEATIHVAATTTVYTAAGFILGRAGDAVLGRVIGTWTKEVTIGSIDISIQLVFEDVAASFTASVAGSAAELVFVEFPEAIYYGAERLFETHKEQIDTATKSMDVTIKFDN